MATSFKREPKMMTTEPSVDEVKMKNGGKMMHGGKMKNGGKADMSQDKAMIKKAMKQHDAQEHKGGKGTNLKLRKGGMSSRMSNMAPKAGPNVMGGLAGGLEATRPDMKKMTSGVRMPGYKMGGSIAAKGMAIAKKYEKTTNTGNPMPSVKGGTKGIKQGPAGYKDGGHAAMMCKSEGGFASMKKMEKC